MVALRVAQGRLLLGDALRVNLDRHAVGPDAHAPAEHNVHLVLPRGAVLLPGGAHLFALFYLPQAPARVDRKVLLVLVELVLDRARVLDGGPRHLYSLREVVYGRQRPHGALQAPAIRLLGCVVVQGRRREPQLRSCLTVGPDVALLPRRLDVSAHGRAEAASAAAPWSFMAWSLK